MAGFWRMSPRHLLPQCCLFGTFLLPRLWLMYSSQYSGNPLAQCFNLGLGRNVRSWIYMGPPLGWDCHLAESVVHLIPYSTSKSSFVKNYILIVMVNVDVIWAPDQIRQISGCTCAGNAGNVFPATDFKGNRQLAIPTCITARASRTCRDACIANPRQEKRTRYSRRMRNPQFYVSDKRPRARSGNINVHHKLHKIASSKRKLGCASAMHLF